MVDLSTAAGFATTTLSNASGVLNLLAGLNNAKWNIQEAAYGHSGAPLVLFHVFKSQEPYGAAVDQIQDNIARRLAEFEFPYVDGQTTDDLGRKAESYEFNILLFGPQYYAAYVALLAQFNNPAPGTLVHPVRGRFTAKFKEASVIHKSSEKQAITLRARFVEHTFESSFTAPSPTTKSALATAVGFIASITNVFNTIQSNITAFNQILKQVSTIVASYNTSYTLALVAMNTTFNSGSSSDLPTLLPANPGNGNTFPVAVSPTDPFNGLTPAQVQLLNSPSLSPAQAISLVAQITEQANTTIQAIENYNNGLGAIIYYSGVLTIRQSIQSLQNLLLIGLQSSNAQIINYTTPRLMTIREVCFAVGLTPDDSDQVLQNNPTILSVNYIPQGTILQIPSS